MGRNIEFLETFGVKEVMGLNQGARFHHVVYKKRTGRIIDISESHSTEDFQKENASAETQKNQGAHVAVGFIGIGHPYKIGKDNPQLEHGITDEHHPDCNARRMNRALLVNVGPNWID